MTKPECSPDEFATGRHTCRTMFAKWNRRGRFVRSIQIQQEVYDRMTHIPLGHYRIASAWRTSLSGVRDGPATLIFKLEEMICSARRVREGQYPVCGNPDVLGASARRFFDRSLFCRSRDE